MIPEEEYRPEEAPRKTPLLQAMPHRRYRINPAYRHELIAWLCGIRAEYETQARRTLRGLTGHARACASGHRSWAELMCEAIDRVARSLHDTVPRDIADAALEALAQDTTQPV